MLKTAQVHNVPRVVVRRFIKIAMDLTSSFSSSLETTSRHELLKTPLGAALVHRCVPFMTRFYADTLARLLLSFMPLFDYLDRHQIEPSRIASFGSGSCAHETFLAELFPNAQITCFDASERYLPAYVKEKIAASDRIIFRITNFDNFDWSALAESYDFVLSIQTLEHISDFSAAVRNIAGTVALGGLLYLDAPFYSESDSNEDPNYLKAERERQWEKHKHFHLGFSRQRMARRLKSLGFELVDSGYLAYSAADAKFMHFFRNSGLFQKEHADADVALSLAMTLLTLLRRSEKIHRPRFSEIDQCRHKERPASAIRILARKNSSTSLLGKFGLPLR